MLDLTSAIVADVCCATLMVTHNMEHAIDRGDRIVVMSRGRIVADVAGDDKRSLTVDAVVRLIIQSGDTASDRLLLPDLATV